MGSRLKLIAIPVIAVVLVAVVLYLYLSLKRSPVFNAPAFQSAQLVPQSQTLGGQIYDRAANPIKNKVPTIDPVTNPILSIYRNPFE